MIKVQNGEVMINGVNVTDQPALQWATADGKQILEPTKMEARENWIEIADENEGLYGVYFHGELDCFVRGKKFAEGYLQQLVDEEDYYNGNEKIDEFDLDC